MSTNDYKHEHTPETQGVLTYIVGFSQRGVSSRVAKDTYPVRLWVQGFYKTREESNIMIPTTTMSDIMDAYKNTVCED